MEFSSVRGGLSPEVNFSVLKGVGRDTSAIRVVCDYRTYTIENLGSGDLDVVKADLSKDIKKHGLNSEQREEILKVLTEKVFAYKETSAGKGRLERIKAAAHRRFGRSNIAKDYRALKSLIKTVQNATPREKVLQERLKKGKKAVNSLIKSASKYARLDLKAKNNIREQRPTRLSGLGNEVGYFGFILKDAKYVQKLEKVAAPLRSQLYLLGLAETELNQLKRKKND
jgi:hypothetical protein